MARPLALVNAGVWTMAEPGGRAEAALVEGGRIAAVGPERAILRRAHAAGARILDLGGRRVLPGLIDSHAHLVHQGLLRARVDLWGTTSKRQALARVAAAARRHHGPGPLIAERWDESRWRERAAPARDELDAITTRFPLVLRRVDGHFAVGNGAACHAVGDRLPGVDPDTGHLVEEASLNLNQVWPTPVPDAARAGLDAQATALRLGLTTVHDFVVPAYLRAWQRLARARRLRLRVVATPYVEALPSLAASGIESGLGDAALRLGGVKVFADGSLGGHTAALRKPYADRPGHRGRLTWSDAALREHVRSAAAAGLQPSIHAIGDAAIDQVLDAYALLAASARRRLRPRVEHFEVHTPDQVERAVALGLVLSMQPNFVGAWTRRGGMYHRRFGDDRYRRNNEFRRLAAAGARLAFGSDCMPLDPWFGVESVVRATHAAQRLPVEAALRAYTAGSAYGLGLERDRGTVAPGKRADLVVVDGDWRRAGGVARTRVRATMVGGAWAFGPPKPVRAR